MLLEKKLSPAKKKTYRTIKLLCICLSQSIRTLCKLSISQNPFCLYLLNKSKGSAQEYSCSNATHSARQPKADCISFLQFITVSHRAQTAWIPLSYYFFPSPQFFTFPTCANWKNRTVLNAVCPWTGRYIYSHVCFVLGVAFLHRSRPGPELRLWVLHSIEKTMQLSAKYKQVETTNRCLMGDSTERGTMNW